MFRKRRQNQQRPTAGDLEPALLSESSSPTVTDLDRSVKTHAPEPEGMHHLRTSSEGEQGQPAATAGLGVEPPGQADGVDDDAGSLFETTDVLLQLCGELLLQPPPTRPPRIEGSGATIGLELLNLLLNPDHVLRITEELTLRNTLALDRRVRLDISLDRLSRQQENSATQMSALVSGRVGLHETTPVDPERLWLPLDTVPRPISVAVTATDPDGTSLPRPPQPAIRMALAAALDHILLESLRAHPDVEDPTHATYALMRDNPARWLLQGTLKSVAELGAGTHRARERLQALRRHRAIDKAPLVRGAELSSLVGALARAEAGLPAKGTALRVVQDVVLQDGPFRELLRLVHDHYFVVAGLNRRVREHIVCYDLPESEATAGSAIRSPFCRLRGGFDPREHNYSAHVKVPVPDNIDEYNLYLHAAPEAAANSNAVSLIGAIHFDGHPAQSSLEALSNCADQLAANLRPSKPDHDGTDDTTDGATNDDVVALKLAYIASQAAPALDRVDTVADRQNRAVDELEARSTEASTRFIEQLFSKLRRVAMSTRDQIAGAREELSVLLDSLRRDEVLPTHLDRTTAAMRESVKAMQQPLFARQLASSELTGREFARVRLSRARGTRSLPADVRPRVLEIWATVSDEAKPYALGAIIPPLALAILVYMTGALLFDTAQWPFQVAELAANDIASHEADAIVGVLLLIPGFALTQFKLPDRLSVSGRLHRPGRFFVVVAIVTLSSTSIVVATQLAGSATGHPHIVLWTFRGALGIFMICSLWAILASALRKRYSWRPKGLQALLLAGPTVQASGPPFRRTLRSWATNSWRYNSKPPDADFDLTKPHWSPWQGMQQ